MKPSIIPYMRPADFMSKSSLKPGKWDFYEIVLRSCQLY